MTVLERLSAQQRTIVELVVERGRSYQSLADELDIPAPVVAELARAALVSLAPVTGARVEEEWRGPLADYLLGQQSARESRATREHVERSEAARAWAESVLDSLDSLYGSAARPRIPSPGGAAVAAPARVRPDAERAGSAPAPGRENGGGLGRGRRAAPAREAGRERNLRGGVGGPGRSRRRLGRSHRPAWLEAALGRPRLAVLTGVLALVVIAVGIVALSGGSSTKKAHAAAATVAPPQLVGVLPLQALGNSKAQGAAAIAARGARRALIIQARLPPTPSGYTYVVWLTRPPHAALALGAQVTDKQGNYRGAGPLPANYRSYKYVEVALVKLGRSAQVIAAVARGTLADLRSPPAQSSRAPAVPAPGAAP